MKKWNNIPRGIDVLITCQPPLGKTIVAQDMLTKHLGHGDADYTEEHLGDVDLLGNRSMIENVFATDSDAAEALLGTVTCRVGPAFHIFGCSREGLPAICSAV